MMVTFADGPWVAGPPPQPAMTSAPASSPPVPAPTVMR